MKKALAIILAIAMFASIGAFLLSKRSEPKTNDVMTVNETENFTLATSIYTTRIDIAGANGEKYLPTFVDGIYYTATLDGTVKFYDYNQGKFTPSAAEVKKASVKMNISKDSIPVTISYIVADGKTIGYGVYTSDKGGSDYYEYAFAELRNMPEGYGTSYLLLADYDKEDFYKADKVYDEIFEYDLAAKSVGVKYSQNTRLIDHNGTYRQDWAMLTDAFIKGMGSEKYFLSSRYYNEDEKYLRCDVMVYSSAYRPTIVVKDIMGQWFVKDDAGMHYIKKTDTGFKVVCKKDGDKKAKDVKQFTGDFEKDYILSGNYILDKISGDITNLITGKTDSLKYDVTGVVSASINADGTRAVLTFEPIVNANKVPVQRIVYASANSSAIVYDEPLLYSEGTDFIWIENDRCMSVRAITEDGTTTGSIIYTYTEE